MNFRCGRENLYLFLAFAIFASSCRKEQRTTWDTELLVPIATTSLTLQNLAKDSVVKTNADNSLTLAFTQSLYRLSLAEAIIEIPDTSIGQKYNLTDIALPYQEVFFRSSLGALAINMLSSPSTQFLGQFLLGQNGNYIPVPPISGISPGSFHYDATAFFDSAMLTSGEVELTVFNNLPIPISGATLNLKNTGDGSLITSYTLPWGVNAHDSAFYVISIAGARVTSQLDFEIINLSSPGSNGTSVLIDTSNSLDIKLFVTRLKASEAWAKFPAQNVVDITEDVTQEINDRKFTYVDARSGHLKVFITSSVPQKLYLEYTLVGAYDKSGNPLKVFTTVPPAPPGGTSTIDDSLDMAGFSINLTGKDGAKFNSYTQRIIAHIDEDTVTHHITTSDSIKIRYEITKVAPNYIKGYAGRDTLSTIDTADFDFLNIFKSGSLDLEAVNMNFSVENGIGVDGQVKINSLTAVSPNNGSRTLTGSIVGQPLVINRASDFPLTPAVSNFAINNSNSNIKDLLGILPNKLIYNVEVKTNMAGNTQQYRDFAYLESALKINLNAEVPLSLIANNLVLKDTFDFDISQTNTNINGISDGIINLIAQNKYPIEAVLTMVLYDENWNEVDTLMMNTTIAAADLNNDCKTETSKRSKVPMYVNEERMENVKRAKHAVVTADFSTVSSNTICNGRHLKIYSDYKLEITFTARFNYKVNAKF